jgi:RNA polymerase sigma-70 factor (ECF subfamily)
MSHAQSELMDASAVAASLMPECSRFVRLARLRLATKADAEDVVQQALARAVAGAASIKDPAQVRAWFYRILRRSISDHHRARPHDPMRQRTPSDLESVAAPTPPEHTPCACCVRLLSHLPPMQAAVIRRVDLEGHDPGDEAKALGVTMGNLYVRLHRARRTLREHVEQWCGVASHHACSDCACDALHRCGDQDDA